MKRVWIYLSDLDTSLEGKWWSRIYANFRYVPRLPSGADQYGVNCPLETIWMHKQKLPEDQYLRTSYTYLTEIDGVVESFELKKTDVIELMVENLVQYLEMNQTLPAHLQFCKYQSNGAALFVYQPTKFDKFKLKIATNRINPQRGWWRAHPDPHFPTPTVQKPNQKKTLTLTHFF